MGFWVQGWSCILVGVAVIFSGGMCLAKGEVGEEGEGKCDIYEGSWVVDESYPMYNSTLCPHIRREFDCQKYGRPDKLYLRYKWQPKDCDLPRFDGQDFLRRFKGKKIMYIGDSISLNQWQSMVCLLYAVVPDQSRIFQNANGPLTTVIFQDYDLSIMVFHSPYLVDIEIEEIGRVLKLDSLKNGSIWKTNDIVIFNTWLWWYRSGRAQPWDYIQDGDQIKKDMDRMVAFKKALITWAKWVDSNVDFNKTQVFFRGVTPAHYDGKEWDEPRVTNCSKETQPISGSTYPSGLPQSSYVLEGVLSGVTKPVQFLNITTLSQLRKDGHPSMYNGVNRSMDCTHWCIAGVPDTWNQLLYAALISQN
uniref:Uncharacterized protein n=2 Tax=Vitis vinifera TaxID=29760 RepID=F6GX83_VITVI|eukprot:XP_003634905.1 PREDICTED: protein trichome birefringence-like 38 [Vitis vinifera]